MLRRLVLVSLLFISLLVVKDTVFAYTNGTYSSGDYGSCDYGTGCSITLTSGGTVSLDITPVSGVLCTIQSDTASVETDDTNGYTLTLANDDTDTSLVNGASSIPVGSGTLASPVALAANTWGYRVDSLGSFGSGPTTNQSNVSPTSAVFAAVPASNATPDTIALTSSAANPAVDTVVWYGACANTSVTSGTYTTQVMYTAVAN